LKYNTYYNYMNIITYDLIFMYYYVHYMLLLCYIYLYYLYIHVCIYDIYDTYYLIYPIRLKNITYYNKNAVLYT